MKYNTFHKISSRKKLPAMYSFVSINKDINDKETGIKNSKHRLDTAILLYHSSKILKINQRLLY